MFADILKQLRAEVDISQGKLAELIGVSGGNISSWEGGGSKPGYTALCSLAQFFGVSADYLLELSPKKRGEWTDELRSLNEFKAEQGLVCDGLPLDDAEVDLVAMFRLLPPSHQEEVFDLVYLKYKRHVEQKKESIFWTYFDKNKGEKSGPAEDLEARDGTA